MESINMTCPNGTSFCKVIENLTEEETDDDMHQESVPPRVIFQLVLAIIETIVGLSGNGIVVCLIVTRKPLQTICNFYILNRAIAEILFQLPNVLLFISIVKMNFIFGRGMCIFWSLIVQISALISTATLVLMCIDCYISTRQDHHSYTFRAKLMKISLWVIWIVGVSILGRIVVHFNPYHTYPEREGSAMIAYCIPGPFLSASTPSGYIISVCVGFILPLSLIWIYIHLSFQPKVHGINRIIKREDVSESVEGEDGGEVEIDVGGGGGEEEVVAEDDESRAVYHKRFIVILAVLFTICQLAFWSATMSHVHDFALFVPYLYEGAITLFDLNTALNPILYIIFAKDLYQEFVKLLPMYKDTGEPLQAVYFRRPESRPT